MFWEKWIQLIVGTGLAVAQPVGDVSPKFTIDDVFSYDCARSIVRMVASDEPLGPLFAAGPLLFSSVQASDGSVLLLVNAGLGTYSIPLEKTGVNRIRFELPTRDSRKPVRFFISYAHGGTLPSRYVEFSLGIPPVGRDDLDYTSSVPVLAPHLKPHFEYAIHETASQLLNAVTNGRVARTQFRGHQAENCEVLYRTSPRLAQTLRRNIDELEMLLVGPARESRRMPASVSPL